MARVKRHSDETRAAIMAALLAGQRVNEVAETYHIDKSIVSRIKAKLPTEQLQRIATKGADEFSELVSNYLREILTTTAFLVAWIRDNPQWIAQQSAAEIATLLGVTTDKAVRLLEAAQAAHEQPVIDVEATPGTADPGIPEQGG